MEKERIFENICSTMVGQVVRLHSFRQVYIYCKNGFAQEYVLIDTVAGQTS